MFSPCLDGIGNCVKPPDPSSLVPQGYNVMSILGKLVGYFVIVVIQWVPGFHYSSQASQIIQGHGPRVLGLSLSNLHTRSVMYMQVAQDSYTTWHQYTTYTSTSYIYHVTVGMVTYTNCVTVVTE